MKKEKTSFYAGNIKISILGEFIKIKSVSISKRIDTVTDSFSFVTPVSFENYIPNVFGLKVDVFVNDEFYTGGIIINRKIRGTDIIVDCSTHGWQLCNSDIITPMQYNNENLGNFIQKVCDDNFKYCYDYSFSEYYLPEVPSSSLNINTQNNGEKKELHEYEDINFTSNDLIINDNKGGKPIHYFVLNGKQIVTMEYKNPVSFIIYDPYNLYNTNLSQFFNQEEKKMDSNINQTVFDYIKNVTSVVNVFIKCIGLYSDLKNKLEPSVIKTDLSKIKIENYCYVLLLYRPGIDIEIFKPKRTNALMSRNIGVYKNIGNVLEGKVDAPFTSIGSTTITFEEKKYGKVINDGTMNSNCLDYLEENFNGENNYSMYFLYTKDNKDYVQKTKQEGDTTEEEAKKVLSEKNQYFCKTKFDSTINIGNSKNIIINDYMGLTEYAANRRLNYEINKNKAESYTIKAKVIGYTIDMNFSKVNFWENDGNNVFWDVNKTVLVYSPEQMIYNSNLIVKELQMNYDTNTGATTELTLTAPLCYNANELSLTKDEIDEIVDIKKQQLLKNSKKGNFVMNLFKVTDFITFGARPLINSMNERALKNVEKIGNKND